MGETFWGIFWGFIGGTVLTFLGSWGIHLLEVRRAKEHRKRILKTLLREIEDDLKSVQNGENAPISTFFLPSFGRARETGALTEMPDNTYKSVVSAYERLSSYKEKDPKTSMVICGLYKGQSGFKDLEQRLQQAVKELSQYLDC